MRKIYIVIGMFVFSLAGIFVFAEEDGYIINAVKISSSAIKIDGRLDEKAWQKAESITGFKRVTGGTELKQQTFVKVLYSEESLYIGVEFEEPEADKLAARSKGTIWGSDRIEFPISPNIDEGIYYLFGVDCDGDKLEGIFGSPEYDDGIAEWNPEWHASVTKGKDRWFIEIKIPFKIFNVKPAKGGVWGINFCRQRSPGYKEIIYSAWNPKYSGFHYTGGRLIFE